VDNDGRGEILVIEFSHSVLANSATLSAWANDFDVVFWGGTGTLSLSSFNALGAPFFSLFGPPNNAPANGSLTRTVDLSPLANPIDWLIIGPPPFTLNPDEEKSKDMFKFKTVVFTVPEEDTAEPGSIALLLIGAALLAARSRKQS
jgi:hypothetical protein